MRVTVQRSSVFALPPQVRELRRFRTSCKSIDCIRRADSMLERIMHATSSTDRVPASWVTENAFQPRAVKMNE